MRRERYGMFQMLSTSVNRAIATIERKRNDTGRAIVAMN
jgi:hypothetical protein